MLAASFRRTVLALSLATLAVPPAVASAQPKPPPTSAERQEVARMKAEQGLKLFGADRWAEAYEWFREADVLYHAPTISLYMGRCLRKLGRLLEARAQYEKLAAEAVARDAPPAFVEAHDAAKTELDLVNKSIPTLEIAVIGAQADAAKLTLDGKPASRDKRELDPGNHTIEATGAGTKAVKSFTLPEGAHQRIELTLGAQPAGPPTPPPAVPDAQNKPVAARGSLVPAGILLGVGGVGVAVGAITGAMSLSKVSDIKSRCKEGLCASADRAEADSARVLGNVSTATFILGGVAAATGVVLVIVRPRFGKNASKTASGLDLNAAVGPGRLEIAGRF